ncbi:DUF4419 domain-containing protein [Plantactinospora endophytica]|uniref:Uncharacterized protein n=1 Tax=Plantactinospora endophytica TaxID=673535 RepID=A0ABQ4DY73_9ACTN|nr:DUF4419 domain-containing protein [Plantactinospora endophytica]GIG87409.1 hypothetical protein Pen02_23450 [Plantactinospora endophytica]
MVTFPVDAVSSAAEPLPTRPLGQLFDDALVVGGDPALPVLAPNGVHPLLGAVGRAFAEHRPLVLSPDAVWLTIAQGAAQQDAALDSGGDLGHLETGRLDVLAETVVDWRPTVREAED